MSDSSALSQLLEPDALARVQALRLQVVQVVEGLLMGLHRSPHHGSSVEFSEHKEYAPGDETRHIDWRIFAKSDKYYVKRFEQETNATGMLLCDASASMLYSGGGTRSKYEYASSLAAAMAYVMLRQQDAVGLMVAASENNVWIPPVSRGSHLLQLCELLIQSAPVRGAKTDLSAATRALSDVYSHRGPVFVFSDFLDASEAWLKNLRLMEARKQHITLVQVLDPWELAFPFDEMTAFRALESSQRLVVDARGVKKAYLEALRGFIAKIRATCQTAGMGYRLVSTARPLADSLADLLFHRQSIAAGARDGV